MEIIPCTIDHEPAWDAFVRNHPSATYCHLTGWRSIFGETYGHRDHYLLALDSSRVCGVLPLMQLKGLGGGSILVSMPFLDSGGILSESPEVERRLLLEALDLRKRLGITSIEFRHLRPPQWFRDMMEEEDGLQDAAGNLSCLLGSRNKASMFLKLPETSEQLMSSFKAKLRSQIKRPLKEGCTAAVGGTELLDDFYRVFAQNMRDLGSPVHSRKLFSKIFENLPDAARTFVVRKEGIPIAASVVIGFGKTLSNPWASSLKQYSQVSPNMLLYWTMLAYACENGFTCFDFGRSSWGEGTFRFKEQWGSEPHRLNWLSLSEERPQKSRFNVAISCWKRLPLPLTRIAGPAIRKHIAL